MRRGLAGRGGIAVCAVLGACLGSAPPGWAATVAVTTEDDVVAADGSCSLREAITAANTDAAPFAGAGECAAGSGADTVSVPAGTFRLGIPGPGEDANAAGDLDILGTELTIAGAGSSATTIDANLLDRAIDVRVGRIATIQDLKITGGTAPKGANGTPRTGSGSTFVSGDPGDPGEPGGGIRNLGTLTVLRSAVFGNSAGLGGTGGTSQGGNASNGVAGGASGGKGGAGGAGGGIYTSGVLTVIRSTVSGNTAGTGGAGGFGQGGQGVNGNAFGGLGQGGTGGRAGDGGGIAEADGGTLTVRDSSITGNGAGVGGQGGVGQGGAGGPAGFMSTSDGGSGGEGSAGPGGDGGAGGGISAADNVVLTGVLLATNVGGTGGRGGNANGSVGGPALGTSGDGGNGGQGIANIGGDGGPGGGLLAAAASLVDVTVSGNRTGAGGSGGNGTGGQGGGSLNGTGGNGSVGYAGDGGDGGSGGGLTITGQSTIRHATIASNTVGDGGPAGTAQPGAAGQPGGSPGLTSPGAPGAGGSAGAVSAPTPAAAAATLANSVIAANAIPSCVGSVADGGFDIAFPDASCPGANVDPKLGPLADNGGPTQTHAIGPGSPARDSVPSAGAGCAETDQRAVARPQAAGCDAGAYEWAPPTVTTGASTIARTSATLHGEINPNARDTTYHFEIGTDTRYGRDTAAASTGAGTTPVAVQADVGGLVSGTTYHYRLVATNGDGTTADADRTFVFDNTPPRFVSASVSPKRFAVRRSGRAEQPVAARTRRGTRFRYRLSEPARVLFTIARARPGRKAGSRCVKPTRRNRGKRRCTRWVTAGRFAAQGGTKSTTKRFSGRIGRRSLRPGRHRATLTAIDAAGNASKPRLLRFRVVRARSG
jgi:CSLREA domain-containing protein